MVNADWPEYDESKMIESTIEMVVMINGKVRDKIRLPLDTSKEEVISLAMATNRIKELIADKEIRKVIVVPNKLVNIVV